MWHGESTELKFTHRWYGSQLLAQWGVREVEPQVIPNESKAMTQQHWHFDNSLTRLPATLFTRTNPVPVRTPQLVLLNEPVALSLGLDPELLREHGAAIFAGNCLPDGAEPIAQAYAGHQFGSFTNLGDGRAILLGEQIAPTGERFDIQLKGAGRTPYSRQGDGRAALGPMLREYIISEAMAALGIPTSRTLAVVTTGETVQRETAQPGAVLTRVMSSHLRVGSFEYAARCDSPHELTALADYTIWRHFPQIGHESGPVKYRAFLREVSKRQARLIALWQQIGFIHGVMNTDNMALAGETFDYGPCAFMDGYDPATVFSSIDQFGRYAYGNQPYIAAWNLARFAETLLPLLDDDRERAIELAQEQLQEFVGFYTTQYEAGMREKLGLLSPEPGDRLRIDGLLGLMQRHQADYTNTLRDLATVDLATTENPFFRTPDFQQWYQEWQQRRSRQEADLATSTQLMLAQNPAIIPRNHQVEIALTAAVQEKEFRPLQRLLQLLGTPFSLSPADQAYSLPAPPSSPPYHTFCGT